MKLLFAPDHQNLEEGKIMATTFIKLFLEIFGLEEEYYPQSKNIKIRWNQAIRKGELLFIYLEEINKIDILDPVNEDLDFLIFITLPSPINKKVIEKRFASLWNNDPRIFFWLPAEMDISNLNIIKQYAIKKKMNLHQQSLDLVKQMYLHGTIHNNEHNYNNFSKQSDFNHIIEGIMNIQLNQICSKHPGFPQDISHLTMRKTSKELINRSQWEDYMLILQEFDYNLDFQYNLISQDHFWKNIINIQQRWKEDLKQTIRINSQLCYLLEEESRIKEVNYPLFRLHHVFDQHFYRFDNDSYPGLQKFLKVLLATYGDINTFSRELKLVKEILYFIKKRHDQILIEEYRYLKNISLPLRGYEDLRIALITVLKKFAQLRTILTNPQAFNELNEDIRDFKQCFISKYKEEHLHFQEELNKFNNQLHSLPEYKILEILSEIKVVKVAYNMKPIKKYVDTFFPAQCQVENLDELLKKQPKCICGFTLGETLTIPPFNKITPMLRKGINEYIEQLQNTKHFKGLLLQYLRKNPDSPIATILETNPENIDSVFHLINKDLINEINEALSNTYPIKISFEEIAAAVTGSYPVNQLHLVADQLENIIQIIIEDRLKELGNPDPEQIILNLVK